MHPDIRNNNMNYNSNIYQHMDTQSQDGSCSYQSVIDVNSLDTGYMTLNRNIYDNGDYTTLGKTNTSHGLVEPNYTNLNSLETVRKQEGNGRKHCCCGVFIGAFFTVLLIGGVVGVLFYVRKGEDLNHFICP